MSNVVERCTEIFARVMEVDPSIVNADTNPENLPEWDSLSHVQLILELEKELSVSIPPDEAVEIMDFKMICDSIENKMNA